MSNLTMSRAGVDKLQTNGTWEQDNKLFLKTFTGEVITEYNNATIMKKLHRERTIQSGKSATFAATGKAEARYHVAGTPILGSNKIPHTEVVINIDDLLIADVTIYDLDEAKSHFGVRGEYSKQLGQAIAERYDRTLLQLSVLGARMPSRLPNMAGGSVLVSANFDTDGQAFADGMFQAAALFDEKNVPSQGRNIVVSPAQYYLAASTTSLLNKDWGGSGTYADGTIIKIAGIGFEKSNLLPKGVVATEAGQNNKYDGDFTNTVATCFQHDALGTAILKGLSTQLSGADFNLVYQSTLIVSKCALGHGVLRPECCIEFAKA